MGLEETSSSPEASMGSLEPPTQTPELTALNPNFSQNLSTHCYPPSLGLLLPVKWRSWAHLRPDHMSIMTYVKNDIK